MMDQIGNGTQLKKGRFVLLWSGVRNHIRKGSNLPVENLAGEGIIPQKFMRLPFLSLAPKMALFHTFSRSCVFYV